MAAPPAALPRRVWTRPSDCSVKALEIDPQLARAHVGLAYIYEYRIDFGLGSVEDNIAKLMEAARNAVAAGSE